MEDDMQESRSLEQPAKLPAFRYLGLLFLIVTAVGLLVFSILSMVLGR
jgi:hypothetical protein